MKAKTFTYMHGQGSYSHRTHGLKQEKLLFATRTTSWLHLIFNLMIITSIGCSLAVVLVSFI